MPKIISYTPSWLSRPSAGFDLFCKTKSSTSEPGVGGAARTQNGSRSSSSHVCHQRTIARRGTEIFVVVDNEIRWSDLCLLRDIWQDGQSNSTKRKTTNSKAAFGGAKGEEADYAKDSYRVRDLISKMFNSNSWLFCLGFEIPYRRTNTAAFGFSQWHLSCYFNLAHGSCGDIT